MSTFFEVFLAVLFAEIASIPVKRYFTPTITKRLDELEETVRKIRNNNGGK